MWYSTYNALKEWNRLQKNFDFLFDNSFGKQNIRNTGSFFPEVSIVEGPEDIRVLAFAPGFNKDDFDITIQGSTLSLSGKRVKPEHPHCCYKEERFSGEFSRIFTLPRNIDSGLVKASYENGVLTMTVAKKAESAPKRIEVKNN